MSWQTDALAEQDMADTLWEMGEAEWRDVYCNEQPWYNKYVRLNGLLQKRTAHWNVDSHSGRLFLLQKALGDIERGANAVDCRDYPDYNNMV